MFRHISLLALLVAIVVGVTAIHPQAASQLSPLTRINNLTFSAAAALPGVTLAPGTYQFEAGPGNTNRNLVRVMNQNRQTVYMGLTIPTSRPRGAAPGMVAFGEAARGEAVPILVWYPGGSNQGHGFLYR
jgi:hypothetical protein